MSDALNEENEDIYKIHARRPKRLENDTIRYFRQLEGLLESLPDGEDREMAINGAFEEMLGKEASLASDKHCSHIVEKILEGVTMQQVRKFVNGCRGFTTHLLSNRYSSHVMERCMDALNTMVQDEAPWDSFAEELDRYGFNKQKNEEGDASNFDEDEESYGGEDDEAMAPMVEGYSDNEETKDGHNDNQKDSEENNDNKEIVDDIPSAALLVMNMSRELQNNWIATMEDFAGTHGIRALISVLGGIDIVRQKVNKKKKKKIQFQTVDSIKTTQLKRYTVPVQFREVLENIVTKFCGAPDSIVKPMLTSQNTSPAIQTLLIATSNSGLCDELSHRFLGWKSPAMISAGETSTVGEDDVGTTSISTNNDTCEWSDNSAVLMKDKIGSRLLEVMLEYVGDELFTTIRKRLFKGNLYSLSTHLISNFSVQKYLSCTRQASQLRSAVDELLPFASELVKGNRMGVVWRLTQGAAKFNVRQSELVDALVKSSGNSKHVVGDLIGLKAMKRGERINFMGAACVASLCEFHSDVSGPVVQSIMSLEPDDMLMIGKCGTGSRFILESVLNGSDDLDYAKNKIAKRLRDRYASLALHRVGSFIVDKLYRAAKVSIKASIVEELLRSEQALTGSKAGTSLLKLCNADRFKRDRNEWMASFERADRKRKMFEDMLNTTNKKIKRDDTDNSRAKSKKKSKSSTEKVKKEDPLALDNLDNKSDMVHMIRNASTGAMLSTLEMENKLKAKKSSSKKKKKKKSKDMIIE